VKHDDCFLFYRMAIIIAKVSLPYLSNVASVQRYQSFQYGQYFLLSGVLILVTLLSGTYPQ